MRNKLTIFLVILTMLICYFAGFIGGHNIGFTEAGARYYPIVQKLQNDIGNYHQASIEMDRTIYQQQVALDVLEEVCGIKITFESERIQ